MYHEHSFHPSIRHDRSYDSATPYEKSLSRIREKYKKDKESIYGVKIDNNSNNRHSQSISDLERVKQKARLLKKHKSTYEVQSNNKFSKLIALASLLCSNEENIIKVPEIYILLNNNIDQLSRSTSIKPNTNIHLEKIINELGMNEVFEISPYDFIEFIKDKGLINEAVCTYEF